MSKMREKLPEIFLILAIVVDFICAQDYPGTVVQHRTNRRRHHRHRGVLQLGRFAEDPQPRSMPLFEATDVDNEIIMEPINLPHSNEEIHTHFDTSDISDGNLFTMEAHPKKISHHSRKHHHRHTQHRRQRKRKKARLKELDEMRKKVARDERKWWRKRKKELQFEEMFFDQETHNPNIIPTPGLPCTKSPQENRTTSRIDHFRYHKVTSEVRVNHQGDGHALPFVAITDPRPRDGVAHKSSASRREES